MAIIIFNFIRELAAALLHGCGFEYHMKHYQTADLTRQCVFLYLNSIFFCKLLIHHILQSKGITRSFSKVSNLNAVGFFVHENFCGEVNVSYCCFVFRIKEEPSEIHFPELDEMDEVNNPEHLLNLNGTV